MQNNRWTRCSADVSTTDIPKPGMMALFSMGLAGLAALRRRRKVD